MGLPRTVLSIRTKPSLRLVAVHSGYLFLLLQGLWAELAAGSALLKDTTSPDTEMQSIIEDLQAALQSYSSVLKETVRHKAAQASHQTPLKKTCIFEIVFPSLSVISGQTP